MFGVACSVVRAARVSSRLYVRTLPALKTQAARLYVLHGTVKTRAEPQLKNRFARGAARRGEAFYEVSRPAAVTREIRGFFNTSTMASKGARRDQSPQTPSPRPV